ncbi:MAG: PAS domain-containing protein [Parvularculaceae bacterium]
MLEFLKQGSADARTAQFKSAAFEGSSVAMMMIDRDFIVTHVNKSTKELLSKNAAEFRKVWPNFDPEKIIGSCIDMFHTNPDHQRRLLSDPSRLPYRTDITVGHFKFALNVGGIFDAKGQYVGNVLE